MVNKNASTQPPVKRAKRDELQDLVDVPNETLAAEYKSWLDLADNEARADLARHIAALANHGGGAIVFGLTDAMQFAEPNPFPKVVYDRDLVAGIVKKYLEPPFQCDVQTITSAAGNGHPVIIVPPHGAVPICAKAGGPIVDGKTKGIVQGVYYTRKPGPESAPILTAAEWAPIIRRCAMHERAAILGAVDAALRGGSTLLAASADALKTWHDAAHAAFLKDIAEGKGSLELAQWHCQFSYAIERSDSQQLDLNQLVEVLRQVNAEVHDLVRTGWSMFYVFTRPEIEPFFNTDPASGQDEQDFLECALLHDTRDTGSRRDGVDMWRVSPDGKATLIREYWEDDPSWNTRIGRAPGTWLSPTLIARSLAEFIRHARGVAERFDAPTTVSFRCEWHGLGGRSAYDTRADWGFDARAGRSDHRVASGTWPVSTLANGWAEVVAKLAAPVARVLGVQDVFTQTWVLAEAPNWLRW